MSVFIKQKQIQGLVADLAAKALDADVVKIVNNLSEVNPTSARSNLDVFSKTEVQNLVSGSDNGIIVGTIPARDALTDLSVSDRIFVTDDGDGKWAMYIVSAITDGAGATSTYIKVADADIFSNALTKEAVKSSYESNADTNAFVDAEKAKLANISITQAVDLDQVESDLAATTTTANSAETTANSALSAANTAQNTANAKVEAFTQSRENFTNLSGPASTPINLSLANPVTTGFIPRVFFNGLLVQTITFTAESSVMTFTVPFVTDISDTISVLYNKR